MELEEINLQDKNRKDVKNIKENKLQEFIDNLNEYINIKDPLRNENEKICVVKDRKNERLTIVNIIDAKEFDIFIAKSEQDIKKLNQYEIYNNIYYTSEETFYDLDLGYNITLKKDRCEIYNNEINIENNKAKAKLEELYFNLKEEEGQIFTVDRIKGEKIYLKGKEGRIFFFV